MSDSIARLAGRVPGDLVRQALGAVSLLGLSGAATLGLGLVALPVLARLYPPTAWGDFAIYQVAAGLLALVFTGRLELGLPLLTRAQQNVLQMFLFRAVFAYAFVLTGLLWLGLELVRPRETLCALLLPIPIGAALLAAISIRSLRLTARARFSRLAGLEAATIGLPLILQILFGAAGFTEKTIGISGLIGGQICGLLVVLVVAGRIENDTHGFRDPAQPRLFPILRQLRAYPQNSLPASLLTAGRERLLVLAAMLAFPPPIVGQIAMAQRLANIPATLVGNMVRPVIFGLGRAPGKHRPATLATLFALGGVPLLAIICGAVAALAVPIIDVLLGPDWQGAAQVLSFLVWVVPFRAAASGLSRLFDLAARQRLAAWLEAGFVGALSITLLSVAILAPSAQNLALGVALVSAGYFQIYAALAMRSIGVKRSKIALAAILAMTGLVFGYVFGAAAAPLGQ